MLQSNAKYTAAEIATELGLDPEEVVGKVRFRVGGLSLNRLDQTVSFQAGTQVVEVIVGEEAKEVELAEAGEDRLVTEAAQGHGSVRVQEEETTETVEE